MKSFKLISSVFLVLSLMFFSGCGWFKSDKTGKKLEEIDTNLTGVWRADCINNDVLGWTHTKRSVNFGIAGDFDKTETFYIDDRCNEGHFEYKIVGTYAAVDKNQDPKKINFTVNEAKIKVTSDKAIQLLNGVSFCGIENWENGKEFDVIGKECHVFTINKGDVIFETYAFNDDKSQLFFGDKFNLLSEDDADSRPEKVDNQISYTKEK